MGEAPGDAVTVKDGAADLSQAPSRVTGLSSGTLDAPAHGGAKYPRSRVLVSSVDRSWTSLMAELRSHPAGRIEPAAQQSVEIVIGIRSGDDALITRISAGKQLGTRWAEGSIWVAPTGTDDAEVSATSPIASALHLYLPVRQFSLVADHYNLSRSAVHSLQYIGGVSDELIRQIGVAILAEMTEESPTGRMLAETASLMLVAWLSHRYSDGSFSVPQLNASHGLDSARLRRVLDYIENHLHEDITLVGLAAVASLSTFHFARMFRAAVGVPPHRYVARRRIEVAKAMLTAGELPLCEIALRSCFSSQASFNRAFLRATGMTPGEYRRRGH